MKNIFNKIQKGFTPLELLMVVGISAVVAGLFIFAASGPKQMAQLSSINVNVDVPEVTVARTPIVQAQEGTSPDVEGVWQCLADRPGSGTFPLISTFHNDGTLFISSGSDLFGPGYSSRGGLQAEWKKLGPDLYQYTAMENLWENWDESRLDGIRDKIAGYFYVISTIYFDRASDTLCSGFGTAGPHSCASVPGAPQNAATHISRISYGNAVGDINLDPANIGNKVVSYKCFRLEKYLSDSQVLHETNCNDGLDNDGDVPFGGGIDGADNDC